MHFLEFIIEISEIIEIFWSSSMSRICCLEIFSLGEEDELTNDDFCLMKLCAIFFIDDTSFQTSFDIDEFSFDEEFLYLIRERSPSDTVCVFCFREGFSSRRFVVAIRRDRECSDFFIERGTCRLDKRVFRDISDKDDFVYSSHE